MDRTPGLERLGQSDLTLASGERDVRNMTVADTSGEEIGTVEDLYIDDHEGRVRFLQVRGGGVLGIGESDYLIPFESISRIEDDRLVIDQTHESMEGAPKYDPDLVLDRDYVTSTYGWYGYAPFWAPTAGVAPRRRF